MFAQRNRFKPLGRGIAGVAEDPNLNIREAVGIHDLLHNTERFTASVTNGNAYLAEREQAIRAIYDHVPAKYREFYDDLVDEKDFSPLQAEEEALRLARQWVENQLRALTRKFPESLKPLAVGATTGVALAIPKEF